MSTEQMREAIKKVYLGDKWKKKVSKMSESQIIAVYYRFKQDKKIK